MHTHQRTSWTELSKHHLNQMLNKRLSTVIPCKQYVKQKKIERNLKESQWTVTHSLDTWYNKSVLELSTNKADRVFRYIAKCFASSNSCILCVLHARSIEHTLSSKVTAIELHHSSVIYRVYRDNLNLKWKLSSHWNHFQINHECAFRTFQLPYKQ